MNSINTSRFCLVLILVFTIISSSIGQVLTAEDSLQAGLEANGKNTFISGYGEIKYSNDIKNEKATINLTRAVLFVGHRFNSKISLFSELEIEDAKLEGGEPGGELAFEQLFLKFNISRDAYITAGLFTPRIGIINENHLPVNYNGNDRPVVEKLIIPATWRELGISLYGSINSVQGLNYSIGIMNGLNAEGFENGTGIRHGRYEGSNASASNIAVTGSMLYYYKDFRFQVSGYYGGSSGLTNQEADSLQLESGAFGTPVALGEANVQYNHSGISVRALFTAVSIPQAYEINRAYENNTPELMLGGYIEAGYNILYAFNKSTTKNLTYFIRYESLDLNYKLPENGITNGLNKQQYITTGLTYQPARGVVLKADYQFKKTGNPNPALIVNPYPTGSTYYNPTSYVNLGLGYSF